MSSIRIDKEHTKLLDDLLAHLTLKGQKSSKKELIEILIKEAPSKEGIKEALSKEALL